MNYDSKGKLCECNLLNSMRYVATWWYIHDVSLETPTVCGNTELGDLIIKTYVIDDDCTTISIGAIIIHNCIPGILNPDNQWHVARTEFEITDETYVKFGNDIALCCHRYEKQFSRLVIAPECTDKSKQIVLDNLFKIRKVIEESGTHWKYNNIQ